MDKSCVLICVFFALLVPTTAYDNSEKQQGNGEDYSNGKYREERDYNYNEVAGNKHYQSYGGGDYEGKASGNYGSDYGDDYNSNDYKSDYNREYDGEYENSDYESEDSSSNAYTKYESRQHEYNSVAQSGANVQCTYGVKFIRHPRDCTKFYQCANYKPFLLTCPSGLYFNIQLEVCDWPSNVDCSSSARSPTLNRYSPNNGNKESFYDNDYRSYGEEPVYKPSYSQEPNHKPQNRQSKAFQQPNWQQSKSSNNPKFGFGKSSGFPGSMYGGGFSSNQQPQGSFGKDSQNRQSFEGPAAFQKGQNPFINSPYAPGFSMFPVPIHIPVFQPMIPFAPMQPGLQSPVFNRQSQQTSFGSKTTHKESVDRQQPTYKGQVVGTRQIVQPKQSVGDKQPVFQSKKYNRSGKKPRKSRRRKSRQRNTQSKSDDSSKEGIYYYYYDEDEGSDYEYKNSGNDRNLYEYEYFTNQPKFGTNKNDDRNFKIVNSKGDNGVEESVYYYYYEDDSGNSGLKNRQYPQYGAEYYYVYDDKNSYGDLKNYADYSGYSNNYYGGSSNQGQYYIDYYDVYQGGPKFQSGQSFYGPYQGGAFSSAYNYGNPWTSNNKFQRLKKGDDGDNDLNYILFDHTGSGGHGSKKSKGSSGLDLSSLLPILLLQSPQAQQLLFMSAILSKLKGLSTGNLFGGKGGFSSKGKGLDKEGLLKKLFLLRLLSGNTATTTATQAANIQLANNQFVSLTTGQPVNLIDPTTGQLLTAADASINTLTGQVVNTATGQPLGVVDPVTGAITAAIAPLAAQQTIVQGQPIQPVNRAGFQGTLNTQTGVGTNNRQFLVPAVSQGTGQNGAVTSRDAVNLIFLSPLTPSSLPPPIIGSDGSATLIRGSLKDILGDDLATFIGQNAPLVPGQGLPNALAGNGQTCSVIRSGESVPFKLNQRNGRQLSTQECSAVGQLLNKFIPTFIQNFVPRDAAFAGFGTNSRRNNNTNNNSVNNNNLPSGSTLNRNSNTGNGVEGNSGNNDSSNLFGDNNINDFIKVKTDRNGCTIAVPNIVPRC